MIRELTVSRCRKPSRVAVTPQKHGYRGELALNKPLTIYSSAEVINPYDTRVRMKRLLTDQTQPAAGTIQELHQRRY
jgi:hypothetical protein